MTPQFDGPSPINPSLRNFGWLLKRRETAVFSSPRPQPIHGGIHRPAAGHGLLEALPVCPTALLVFIDYSAGCQALLRSASCRFRRGSARQMGSRPVYWTSSNLQGCIPSRRR
eukprot:scaffold59679_cov32-Phaeocystis_antarctica.AAC.1